MTTCMVCGKEIPCGKGAENDPIAGFYCSLDCKKHHGERLDMIWCYAVGRYGEQVGKALMEEEARKETHDLDTDG